MLASPNAHSSRLDMMKVDFPEWANGFEKSLIAGSRSPGWSDAGLQSVVPNAALRQQLLRELKPRGLRFFSEQIFAPEDWWKMPGGYVQFTEACAVPAQQAKRMGWPLIQFQAEHFHMLVDPIRVTDALIEIGKSFIIST